MIDVADYIKRAAHRTGYKREFYVEKNIPTQPSNVIVIPFYGDLKSTFLLSSFILKQYKEKNADKYIILCSWPGMSGLFPYVDEYWSIEDESTTRTLATESNNFYNESNLSIELTRNLAEVLNIVTCKDLKEYYFNGFTQKYLKEFGGIKRFFPEVPSSNKISTNFKLQMEQKVGPKIIVYPTMRVKSHHNGKTLSLPLLKDFWVSLIERLIENGFVPVVYQNWFTYDMSRDFVDRCIYLVPRDITDVLAAFRYADCVLDVHNNVSRLAIAARCPFLSVTERPIFIRDKDYEVDDLCCDGLPKRYIFSSSLFILSGTSEDWTISILNHIMAKLKEFVPALQGAILPSTNESYELVSHQKIRQRNARRMGAAFLQKWRKKTPVKVEVH
jgi:hypothetical protein